MINSFVINARQSNKEPTIVEGPQPKIAGNATSLTPRPDNLIYENSTYGIKIQYPSNWKIYPGVNLPGANFSIAVIVPPNYPPSLESD
jgi:hypothetical protein